MRYFAVTAAFLALLGATPVFTVPASAEPRSQSGQFDYYVLSLSWSPGWCATDGQGRNSPQCRSGAGFGFILHGLWPQNETGYPRDCRTSAADPSRADTRAMADIMGSDGLAWHEWKAHGRCSGLSAEDYFATARRAYEAIAIPAPLLSPKQDQHLPAAKIEAEFLAANPALRPEEITVTCNGPRIAEVRICLSKDLSPRPCGADAARDCRAPAALLDAVP